MSTETVSGKFDQVKGSVKQTVGEAVGNDKLANEGAADQLKGHVKEAWGNTKDAVHTVVEDHRTHAAAEHTEAKIKAEDTAHNVRQGIVDSAKHVKDAIVGETDEVRARH
jgi:uncharacterized protein YjbJ (UPF0337 family)